MSDYVSLTVHNVSLVTAQDGPYRVKAQMTQKLHMMTQRTNTPQPAVKSQVMSLNSELSSGFILNH